MDFLSLLIDKEGFNNIKNPRDLEKEAEELLKK